MTDKVLLVEDDPDIAELVRVNLQEIGIQISHINQGREAVAEALSDEYALLLLDLMLPDINGLDICRQVRQARPAQAILMLTAKDTEMDRVVGLELGADDYMTKPFSVRELQARVRAQLRRASLLGQQDRMAAHAKLHLGRLCIDQVQHVASLGQQALELTATEFELLYYLARHPNQVFSRSQLLESVWGYHHSGYEHTVNSHINRLRNKVEKNPNQPQIIQTVWGVGYKLSPHGVQA
ncbi:response regulator transcription factor [Bowmanella yangjiangensis]|uniref:Response regulator transcription factor n=1 Tax=Bowmanella yangjiangensis TaxID=2811230 RepID=A0ABS3CXS0_9ALTE|nr:response regulator transcription factor [Bowmanella yangjiangensis]MBN7821898.1 response regulator transcription factor [Bowmanella yangjiangensis]